MAEPGNEYAEPAPTHEAVIAKAIEDWTAQQADPLALPFEDRAIGSLDLLIKKRLVRAGFIDREPEAPAEM